MSQYGRGRGRVAAQLEVLSLPFDVRRRRLLEHKARNVHREHFPESLVAVTAHWVSAEVGAARRLLTHASDIAVAPEGSVSAPAAPSAATEGGVNARAFITAGVSADDAGRKHVVSRVQLLAAHLSEPERCAAAYGGVVPAGSDKEQIAALCGLVRQQSGMDLSAVVRWHKLAEIEHCDGPRTVFYLPDTSGIDGLTAMPQVTEPREVVDVDADADHTQQAPKKTLLIQPVKTTLHALLADVQVGKTGGTSAHELCVAADLFHEWLRRDAAEAAAVLLHERRAAAVAAAAERRAAEERRGERKRKRDEQLESLKQARIGEELKLRSAWEEMDEGKTDDERWADEPERQQQLQALRDKESKAAQDLIAADDAAGDADGNADAAATAVDQDAVEMLQCIDRTLRQGAVFPREVLISALLCTKEERTRGEAVELATLGGTVPVHHPVNCEELASVPEMRAPPARDDGDDDDDDDEVV